MKTRALAASWALVAAVWALGAASGVARAEPQNGFGAYVGLAAHAYAQAESDGSVTRYESGGLSVAGDMQFVVNPQWSLNPYLALSAESVFGDITGTASNGVAAFQVRRWSGDGYVAAQVGAYVTLLSTGSRSGTRYGLGYGFAIGRERPNGWGYGAVVDFPLVIQAAGRLHISYRWR